MTPHPANPLASTQGLATQQEGAGSSNNLALERTTAELCCAHWCPLTARHSVLLYGRKVPMILRWPLTHFQLSHVLQLRVFALP